MKKLYTIMLVCILLKMQNGYSQCTWVPFDQYGLKTTEIKNIHSTSTKIDFQIIIHGMSRKDTVVEGTLYNRITIPEGIPAGISGSPELPEISRLVAIPECDSITTSVVVTDSIIFPHYHIYPFPRLIEDTNTNMLVEDFYLDSAVYSQNCYFPGIMADARKQGAIRDQKTGLVYFNPLRFNPHDDILIAYNSFTISLTLINPSGDINTDIGLLGNIANKTLLNYTITSRQAKTSYPSATLGVTWYSNTQPQNIPVDYLIVANENFFNPHSPILDDFANYRASTNKLEIGIVNIDEILNSTSYPWYISLPEQKLRFFIQKVFEAKNAPNTFDGHLAYVLLAGNLEYNVSYTSIPASHDMNPGACVHWSSPFPTCTGEEILANDYYYSCVTHDNYPPIYDLEGDLFIGRLLVSNDDELGNVTHKIQYFETEADFSVSPISNLTNTELPTTGTESPSRDWFANDEPGDYFHYLDNLYDHDYYTTLPSEDPSPPEHPCQSGVFQKINDNHTLFLFMYGHSEVDRLLHCHYSRYLDNLAKNKFPFCIAHTCMTGCYNHNDIYTSGCFAENIMKNQYFWGFVGYVGASNLMDLTTSFGKTQPYLFIEYMPKAIWQDLSTLAGEAILEAKINVMKYLTPGYESNLELYHQCQTLFDLNYFGDPALNLMPKGIYITENTTLPDKTVISSPITVKNNAILSLSPGHKLYFEDTGSLTIEQGSTLFIGDGAKIFGSNTSNWINIQGDITGNSANLLQNILFTAFQGNEGNSWGGLKLNLSPTQTVTFNGCNFSYGDYFFNSSINDVTINIKSGYDTNCILHASGRTYFNLNSAGATTTFLKNSRILCDYPEPGNHGYEVKANIQKCTFVNNAPCDYVIRIQQYPKFLISDCNITCQGTIGIDIQNAIRIASTQQEITSNSINKISGYNDGSIGINIYNSNVRIGGKNVITGNDYGIACVRSPNVFLEGADVNSLADAQKIKDNWMIQLKVINASWPVEVHHNRFENNVSDNIPYHFWVYHKIFPEDPNPPQLPEGPRDITDNSWGSGFEDTDLYPLGGYDYSSNWHPTSKSEILPSFDESLYLQAIDSANSENLTFAETLFDSIIRTYPDSLYAEAAVRDLMGITQSGSQDYDNRKYLYQTDSMFYLTENLQRMSALMINHCNILLGNYDEALDWLEEEVVNPNNYGDSICALIDMGFVNALMLQDSTKSTRVYAPNGQKLPVTKFQYQEWYLELLKKLFIESNSNPAPEPLPGNGSSYMTIVSIGPNPALNGMVNVKIITMDDDIINAVVYNLEGKSIKSFLIRTKKEEIQEFSMNLDFLDNGIYFIKIISSKTGITKSQKLIVNS